ncbi:MAG: hypothetical protein ACPGZP_03420 [Panacagrimonas sp.]
MIRITLLTALMCTVLLRPAYADDRQHWPLADIHVDGQDNDVPARFVYVPVGQQFTRVRLRGRVTAAPGLNQLSVVLDGHLLHSIRLEDRSELELRLPDLKPGFHRIDLIGQPAALADQAQERLECPMVTSFPFSINDLRVEYQEYWEPAANPLTALPDGLFNRAHPEVPVGAVLIPPSEPAAWSAAARVVSWLNSHRGIRWQVGLNPGQTPDFLLQLIHDPKLESAAQWTLRRPGVSAPLSSSRQILRLETALSGGESVSLSPVDAGRPLIMPLPRLELAFSTVAGLEMAVNALLNSDYREQLGSDLARIDGAVAEPRWAALRWPETLADFGVEDLVIRGRGARQLTLQYPPSWLPTGIPEGSLRLRVQAGLPKGSHVNVWMDKALSGSEPLAFLGSADIQRSVPVTGASVPDGGWIDLRVETAMDVPRPCELPSMGSLWIDASESALQMPWREMTGLAGLPARLAGQPVVDLAAAHHESFQLLLAVMNSQRPSIEALPLPWVVRTQQAQNRPALQMRVDAEAHADFLRAHANELDPSWSHHTVWMRVDEDGVVRATARTGSAFAAVSRHWEAVARALPDAATDVLINSVDGHHLVLRSLSPIASGRALSASHLKIGIALSLLLLTVAVLLMLRAARRKDLR